MRVLGRGGTMMHWVCGQVSKKSYLFSELVTNEPNCSLERGVKGGGEIENR